MTYRLLRPFLMAGVLLIGLMSLASAQTPDNPNAPRRGQGRRQGAHAKQPQNALWGAKSEARQPNRKNSLWGHEARGMQPPSPWNEKRSQKGLNINPPSPWTLPKRAAGQHFGANGTAIKSHRQPLRYASHPTRIGKWTATRRSQTTSKTGRWAQNTTPGAWKLKQKTALQNGKPQNGKHKNNPPIQTGLPNG